MNFKLGFMEFRSKLSRCHGELEDGSMSAETPLSLQNEYSYRRWSPCP